MGITENHTGNIYTVTKLTRQIKSLLEETFPFVWVTGEISNYAVPASGHSYFTLKDANAVIQAVMFKNQKRNLKFKPENGLKIYGLARLTLYEPRGSYQLIFEHLEPEGAGAAQIAFEQLKNSLNKKGYFDQQHKNQIPFLSEHITIVTSPTGAAIQDILNIAQRRYPNCSLQIVPVKVQGEDSIEQITQAIELTNQRNRSDLIILARGGGSLEDLASFNSEPVANAIFNSNIPIISGVGHETDYTIADFVSDLRAPTPSAAIELALPEKKNLVYTIQMLEQSLNRAIKNKIEDARLSVLSNKERLKSPERVVYDFRLKLEDYQYRMNRAMKQTHLYNKDKLQWLDDSLKNRNPVNLIQPLQTKIDQCTHALNQSFKNRFDTYLSQCRELTTKLEALNPNSVLQRGYSIARRYDNKKVITQAEMVNIDESLEVILYQGKLKTKVIEKDG